MKNIYMFLIDNSTFPIIGRSLTGPVQGQNEPSRANYLEKKTTYSLLSFFIKYVVDQRSIKGMNFELWASPVK